MQPNLPSVVWLLVHRGTFPWRPVMFVPGYAAAFSTHGLAAAFADRACHPEWEFRLSSQPSLARLSPEFRRHGAHGVILDPTGKGEGAKFDLVAIERSCQDDRPPVRRGLRGVGAGSLADSR
jgi:hypothetical protein